MPKSGITLGEFTGLKTGPQQEESYDANLRECLLAKKCASSEGDLSGSAHASRGAAECYRRLGRLEEASREYQEALAGFKLVGDHKGLGWTFFTYSNFLRQQSRFSDALNVLARAEVSSQYCTDIYLQAYIHAGIAETNRILGDYILSESQHLQAFRVFRALGDIRGTVWALEGVGQILKNRGRIRDALEYFTEARKLANANRDRRGFAYALKCQAECLALLGSRTAVDESNHAIQVFRQIGFEVGLAYAYKSCGDIHSKMGDYASSLRHYRQAAQLFANSGDLRGLAYTINGLGRVLCDTGDSEGAAACFAQAYFYFSDSGITFGRFQSSTRLRKMLKQGQLTAHQLRGLFEWDRTGWLAQARLLNVDSQRIPERREVRDAGWRLLNRYRRMGIRYLRRENAKVWEGSRYADCSSFVQHALIEAGYNYAREGRLTTDRLQFDNCWKERFEEVPISECKPGDIILEGGSHMGILSGFNDNRPTGFQMGINFHATELLWGAAGKPVRYFRPRHHPSAT